MSRASPRSRTAYHLELCHGGRLHIVADLLLLLEVVGLGRVQAEVYAEADHVFFLLELGCGCLVDYGLVSFRASSAKNSDAELVRISVRIIQKERCFFLLSDVSDFSNTTLLNCGFVAFQG